MEKEKPMSHVFRPGDKVKAPAFYGDRIFTLQECADETYTLQIFGDHETACESFTADGRVSVYHTRPVLTLVERKKEPRKLVKKERRRIWIYASSFNELTQCKDFTRLREQPIVFTRYDPEQINKCANDRLVEFIEMRRK